MYKIKNVCTVSTISMFLLFSVKTTTTTIVWHIVCSHLYKFFCFQHSLYNRRKRESGQDYLNSSEFEHRLYQHIDTGSSKQIISEEQTSKMKGNLKDFNVPHVRFRRAHSNITSTPSPSTLTNSSNSTSHYGNNSEYDYYNNDYYDNYNYLYWSWEDEYNYDSYYKVQESRKEKWVEQQSKFQAIFMQRPT